MNAEFPWGFVSYWGFLGIAFIYFIDGLIDYKVRSRRSQGNLFNNRFLISFLIRRNKNARILPSIFYSFVLIIPGMVAFLIGSFILPNLPAIWAGIILAMLFIFTWFFSSRMSQDFLSAVFFAFATGLFVIIIARFVFLEQFIALGFRPDNFLSLFLLVALIMFGMYPAKILPKFMPNYKWKPIKVWAWEHLIQTIFIFIWFFGLLFALFPKELFIQH